LKIKYSIYTNYAENKKTYYYIFYNIYKSIIYTSEMVGGEFWIDFKAGLVILTHELFIWMAILN